MITGQEAILWCNHENKEYSKEYLFQHRFQFLFYISQLFHH